MGKCFSVLSHHTVSFVLYNLSFLVCILKVEDNNHHSQCVLVCVFCAIHYAQNTQTYKHTMFLKFDCLAAELSGKRAVIHTNRQC